MTDEKIKPVALLPCPFCGSPPVTLTSNVTAINCSNDQCIIYTDSPSPFNDFGHHAQAIEAWNRRDESALLQAKEEGRIAGLREAAKLLDYNWYKTQADCIEAITRASEGK
jgi:hypothetical protein